MVKILVLLQCLLLPASIAWAQGRAWHQKNRPAYKKRRGTKPKVKRKPQAASATTQKALNDNIFGRVERGEMKVLIHTRGSVRAEEVFRLKSSIEGRIEDVHAKPKKWFPAGKRLAHVLNKEYAALMDAKSTTPSQIIEERWQRVYQPTPIRCDSWCFILKVYARKKNWVQPEAILIEGARKLRLVGRIRSGDGKWIEKGQLLTYWARSNPRKRQQVRIERFVLDTQGTDIESGGTFTALLNHRHYLNPGTEWEGVIEAEAKDKVLKVPTDSLIRIGDQVFLPVQVSTGITTHDYTEITAGVENNRLFLKVEEAKRGPLKAHTPPPATLRPKVRKRRERKRRRRQRERVPITAPRRKKVMPPPIDVFPELIPEDNNDDRFPSDLQ
jgi:hypothetical protein